MIPPGERGPWRRGHPAPGRWNESASDGVSVAGSVVSPSTVWTSKHHSVLVPQIVFDENGQTENATELLSVQCSSPPAVRCTTRAVPCIERTVR